MSDVTTQSSIQISTFGCKVNTYDSGLLEKRLMKSGFQVAGKNAQLPKIHILNSCAVTAEATQDVLRQARKLKRDHPESYVVVTGCSAQVDTEKIEATKEVDLVVANSHKGELETLLAKGLSGQLTERVFKSNIFKKEDTEGGGGIELAHTRAFLKIQDGCNSFCTYCVIPFARGKSRSLTIEELRTRAQELLESGSREIVLTGVHIGDYEFGLENLIEDLLLKTRVPRLRLTSLEPIELTDRLFELYQDPRMCPHFHMSIQSANTSVLKGMKRKYAAEDVEWSLKQIAEKVPGAFVGMDVIVGFPGETDEDFADTYERLAALPWTRIHVFPYSERPGTFAVKYRDKAIPQHVITRRADQLRGLSRERVTQAAQDQIGRSKRVLLFPNNRGLSRDYWAVEFQAERQHGSQINSERYMRILDYRLRTNGEPILIGAFDAQ